MSDEMRGLFTAAVLFALCAIPVRAAERCAAGERDVYAQAICLYNAGDLDAAETAFSVLEEAGLENPETIRAHYFLARIAMRRGTWSDASRRLIGIYTLDPTFYREWACDFLLGVCREKIDDAAR
jgi:TolA-binding protein